MSLEPPPVSQRLLIWVLIYLSEERGAEEGQNERGLRGRALLLLVLSSFPNAGAKEIGDSTYLSFR